MLLKILMPRINSSGVVGFDSNTVRTSGSSVRLAAASLAARSASLTGGALAFLPAGAATFGEQGRFAGPQAVNRHDDCCYYDRPTLLL